MNANLLAILDGLFNLALLVLTAIYASFVLGNYRAGDPPPRPRLDLRDPLHCAGQWTVWLGVEALAITARVTSPFFGILSEASADVGEWVLARRHHESH